MVSFYKTFDIIRFFGVVNHIALRYPKGALNNYNYSILSYQLELDKKFVLYDRTVVETCVKLFSDGRFEL